MGEQLQRSSTRTEQGEEQDTNAPAAKPEVDLSDIDRLLEEIDGVLEENAEEFVAKFRQYNGQ